MSFFADTLNSIRHCGAGAASRLATGLSALVVAQVMALADPAVAGPRDFAIIIGNKTYAEDSLIDPAKFADRDALEFKRTARDVLGVPEANITFIENATAANLNQQFGRRSWQAGQISRNKELSSDSILYVYYSGHGMPANDETGKARAFLLTKESNASDPINTGYPLETLITRLKDIKTNVLQEGQVVLIIEACFSGTTGEGKPLVVGTSASGVEGVEFDTEALEEEKVSDDIVVITASNKSQYASWDEVEKHGMFTDVLLNGMWGGADGYTRKGASGKKDGTLTLGELEEYTMQRMKLRLKTRFATPRIQTPTFRGNRDTVIARFGPRKPIRDTHRFYTENTQCKRLGEQETNISKIQEFRKNCRYCDDECLSSLDARVASIEHQAVACQYSDDRWLEISKSRDLGEVEFFAKHNECDKYKLPAKRHLDKLVEACRSEGEKLQKARESGDVRELQTLSENAFCASVQKKAAESYGIYDRACTVAKAEFEKIETTGSVSDLNQFARKTTCPRYQRRAEREAERQLEYCRNDTLNWTKLKFSSDPRALRKLAVSTKCNTIRQGAKDLVASLEETCDTDRTTFDRLKDGSDLDALRNFAGTTTCAPVREDAERAVAKMTCDLDGRKFASVKESGDTTSLKDFIDGAQCDAVKAEAKKHLVTLNCNHDRRSLSELEKAKDLKGMKALADRGETCEAVRTAALRLLGPLDNDAKESGEKPFRDCETCPLIQPLKAACYWMGSSGSDSSYRNEFPSTEIRLAHRFGIGVKEVTVGEWNACVADRACPSIGNAGSGSNGEPIVGVSWLDARTYTAWLSKKTRQSYRLPTEAEWEYAARAGTTTRYAFGEDLEKSAAQFGLRRKGTVKDAGSFAPNAFGLHDMHGNAAELVADCYENTLTGYPKNGSSRSKCRSEDTVTLRGGSYRDPASKVRSAVRTSIHKDRRRSHVGFRVVRTFTTGGIASSLACPARP